MEGYVYGGGGCDGGGGGVCTALHRKITLLHTT